MADISRLADKAAELLKENTLESRSLKVARVSYQVVTALGITNKSDVEKISRAVREELSRRSAIRRNNISAKIRAAG